jgi:DNA gyrase/topoisomerase IV subunit A
VSGAGQQPREDEGMRRRLVVLDAYLRAAKRREEVMDVISDAPDRGEARQLVARLLGVTEVGAESVLGIDLHQFTKGEVAGAQAEYQSLEESLDRGR